MELTLRFECSPIAVQRARDRLSIVTGARTCLEMCQCQRYGLLLVKRQSCEPGVEALAPDGAVRIPCQQVDEETRELIEPIGIVDDGGQESGEIPCEGRWPQKGQCIVMVFEEAAIQLTPGPSSRVGHKPVSVEIRRAPILECAGRIERRCREGSTDTARDVD